MSKVCFCNNSYTISQGVSKNWDRKWVWTHEVCVTIRKQWWTDSYYSYYLCLTAMITMQLLSLCMMCLSKAAAPTAAVKKLIKNNIRWRPGCRNVSFRQDLATFVSSVCTAAFTGPSCSGSSLASDHRWPRQQLLLWFLRVQAHQRSPPLDCSAPPPPSSEPPQLLAHNSPSSQRCSPPLLCSRPPPGWWQQLQQQNIGGEKKTVKSASGFQ